MFIPKGYTAWARKTIDSEIFYERPDKWFKIWFYLISRVNHKTNGEFQRGSGHVLYREIMESTGATKDQIYSCLKWMESKDMIEKKKTTRGIRIKIINYNIYQNPKNYEATQKRNEANTINKNAKNVKKYKPFIYGSYEDDIIVYKFPDGYKVCDINGNFVHFGGDINKIKK